MTASALAWRGELSRGQVPIGVTDPGPHTREVAGYPFAVWHTDPHLLLAGSTGAGKTSAVRWLAFSMLTSGDRLAIFDGKGSGSLAAALEGRDGILGVAHKPGEWVELANEVRAAMDDWYAANLAFESGRRSAPPEPLGYGMLIDELMDICEVAKKGFVNPVSAIARMGRESGVRIAASVLRPDVAEALPGPVKAQLRARVGLGRPTPQTGQMLFEDDYKKAREVADPDAAEIQGRGVAVLGGTAYRVQLPWVPPASEDPSWLPPRRASQAVSGESSVRRVVELREDGLTWREVAAALTAEGYPTRSGGAWSESTARRLVK